MTLRSFKVWRVLEESTSQDGKLRTITKKELVGEIEKPKEGIYVTWMELVERFGEGYYLAEIPKEVHRRYMVPEKQLVRTPKYFEPSPCVHRTIGKTYYAYARHGK